MVLLIIKLTLLKLVPLQVPPEIARSVGTSRMFINKYTHKHIYIHIYLYNIYIYIYQDSRDSMSDSVQPAKSLAEARDTTRRAELNWRDAHGCKQNDIHVCTLYIYIYICIHVYTFVCIYLFVIHFYISFIVTWHIII